MKFRSDLTESQIQGVLGAHMGWSQKVLEGIGVHVVSLATGVREEATVQALQGLPEVEFAELDRIVRPSGITPNDPSYPYQWALPDISAPNAWSTTTGKSSIVIAFLDSGVNAVPDLGSKFVAGWNFWANNSTTTDVSGHGTLAAGAASAIGNNGIGVASPCWGCSIMPVRVSDLNGNSSVSLVAQGLTWLANLPQPPRVAVVAYALTYSSTVSSAAQYFYGKGGVAILPIGNGAGSFDTTPDNPYIVTVSGVDSTNVINPMSSVGTDVDLAAPVTVISTTSAGSYATVSGTSYSAALVGGVAGLVLSVNSCLGPGQVRSILEHSATPLGTSVPNTIYGWGLVNASGAVTLAGSTFCTSLSPAITSSLSASGTKNTAFSYQITATNSPTSYNATSLPSGLSVNTSTGLISGTPSVSGSFSVTISATNSSGTGTATLALTIKSLAPAVTSSLTASGTKNTAFRYQITATNSPTSYNATSLPSGLSVNTSTGLISGTPSVSGSLSVTISATNSSGTGTATLALTIKSPAPAVTISSPANGSTVTGPTKISASATDSTASIVRMNLYIDGILQTTSTSSSLSDEWNANKYSLGSHTIQVFAYDSANNVGSASISVTVQ